MDIIAKGVNQQGLDGLRLEETRCVVRLPHDGTEITDIEITFIASIAICGGMNRREVGRITTETALRRSGHVANPVARVVRFHHDVRMCEWQADASIGLFS